MSIWTCPKCGQKTESFGWHEKPWNSHVCSDIRKETVDIGMPDPEADEMPSGQKKSSLLDFI